MTNASTIRTGRSSMAGDMSQSTFDDFRKLVYDQSGISLGDNKKPLVKGRIQKRMRELRIDHYEDYFEYVIRDNSMRELQELIDAISTNVTSFYREKHQFKYMRELLEARKREGIRRVRVWSAACSTGEEPYTIAIEILQSAGGKSVDAKILATDISTEVLHKCQQGNYAPDKLEPIPAELKNKYFIKSGEGNSTSYQVTAKLRSMISVRRFNLSVFPFKLTGPIDMIFCRNVMIYFDRPTRAKIVSEFANVMPTGGVLFLGHSETLSGMVSNFTCVRPSIYRKE